MLIADVWTAVGSAASVVAAVAALLTIVYARSTVHDARDAREDAHRDHTEAIDEQRAATDAFVRAQRMATAAFADAHDEEMERREVEYDAELRLQRVLQVERVAGALLDLIEVAQREQVEPPPVVAPPMPFRATRIPALLIRLGVAVAVLDRLGGPELATATDLSTRGYSVGEPPSRIVGDAVTALRELGDATRANELLTVPALAPDDA